MSHDQPTPTQRGAAADPAQRSKSDQKSDRERARSGDSVPDRRDPSEKAPDKGHSTHGSDSVRAPNLKDERRDPVARQPKDDVDPKHRPTAPRR